MSKSAVMEVESCIYQVHFVLTPERNEKLSSHGLRLYVLTRTAHIDAERIQPSLVDQASADQALLVELADCRSVSHHFHSHPCRSGVLRSYQDRPFYSSSPDGRDLVSLLHHHTERVLYSFWSPHS